MKENLTLLISKITPGAVPAGQISGPVRSPQYIDMSRDTNQCRSQSQPPQRRGGLFRPLWLEEISVPVLLSLGMHEMH